MNEENIGITTIKSIKLFPQDTNLVRDRNKIVVKNSQTIKDGIPDVDGLHDARMGTTDHAYPCKTCYNKKTHCLGHAGRIELNYPIPNMYMISLIPKWLRIICSNCGQLLTKSIPNVSKQLLFKTLESEIWKDHEPKKCSVCDVENYYIIYKPKENKLEFLLNKYDDVLNTYTSVIHYHEIARIFEMVTTETLYKLKLPIEAHPKNIMMKVLNVVPNTNRQDIKKPGSTRSSSDDLTVFLKYIVDYNNNIRSIPNPIDQTFYNTVINMTLRTYGYFKGSKGNQIKGVSVKATGGRTMMGCVNGFKGKTGLFRGNLLGKRTHHTARAVITGDSNININEVGIPQYIARTLYIEETVTDFNKTRLQSYVYNGTTTYPGSSKIIKKSTKIEYSPDIYTNAVLEVGDIVFRDIINGDPIIINRAPSLKTTSLMSFSAVVANDESIKVIRINPASCNIFDADFDGDAMQLFLASSVSARSEISIIMNVDRNLISTRDSTPNFGLIYDAVLSTFIMTKSNVSVDKYHAMLMFNQIISPTSNSIEPFISKKYGFRDLTSRLFPNGLNYEKTLSYYKEAFTPYMEFKEEDIRLKIINGKHISGQIDNDACGQNKVNTIIHVVNNQFGSARAIKLNYDLQKISRNYIQYTGFSLSLADYLLPQEALDEIHDEIKVMFLEYDRLYKQADEGNIVAPPDKTLIQHFEELQINACKIDIDKFLHIIMRYIDFGTNNTALIISGGGKGSAKDHVHASGIVGQQIIAGKRLPKDFDFERPSPYYQKWDQNPASRGLVANGYLTGITPNEFISLSKSARIETVNTQLNTAQGGEQGRLSGSILGSVSVDNYRRTNKNSIIVQYLYGGNGWDIKYLENTKVTTFSMSDKDIEQEFLLKDPQKHFPKINKAILEKALAEEYSQILKDRDYYRKVNFDLERCNDSYVSSDVIKLPVNVYRILIDTKHNYSNSFKKKTLDPIAAIAKVKKLCEDLPYLLFNIQMKEHGIPLSEQVIKSTSFVNILIRINLCIKSLIKHEINDPMLDIIIDSIMHRFSKVPIQYGTPVGLIAACAVSSITTQYIIDSKHRTGSGGSESAGIGRIKDIYRATPTEKMKSAPMTLLTLNSKYRHDKYMAEYIANHIEMIPLRRFVNEIQIFFEEYGEPTHPQYIAESQIITNFEKYSTTKRPINLTRWCIRFELSKINMNLKNMTLEDIINSLIILFPTLHFVYTAENTSPEFLKKINVLREDIIIVRAYIKSSVFEKSKSIYNTVVSIKDELLASNIRGVEGIISAKVYEIPGTQVLEDGSAKLTKQYKIRTTGTNISKLQEIPYLDIYSILSTSILEVAEVYGIEAARECIVNELSRILGGVARTHFTLYGDEICYTGVITSIEKLGVSKREPNNFLHQMAIKDPSKTIETAVNNALTCKVYGVSPSLLMGMTSRTIGTSFNKLIVDEEMVKQHTKSLTSVLEEL